MRAKAIRRFAAPFRRWPIHPQWLLAISGEEADLDAALARLAGLVVDVGCADGRLARRLPPGAKYVGLDYPSTAVAMYGTRPDVFGDARALPFRDGSADAVILKDVLEHVPGPETALAECARVLRNGGNLLLWMPFLYPVHDAPHDYQRFTAHALVAYLDRHGLAVRELKPVLKPLETAALMMCLAYADAADVIVRRSRWFLPLLPLLGVSMLCTNLIGKAMSWLPSSAFMPAFYRVMAEKVEQDAV